MASSRFSAYKLSFGLIWHDFKLLYANFFHWNLSKIAIMLFAIVFGLLLSLPFIAGIVLIGYSILGSASADALSNFVNSGILDPSLLSTLTENIWKILSAVICFAVVIGIFSFTLTYTYVLMLNVYRGYLEGKKLPVRKNLYFSWQHLKKYLGVLGWTSLYILPPIVFAIIVLLGLFGLTTTGILDPTSDRTHATILGSLAFVWIAVSIIWLLIRALKLSFGYMYLLEDVNIKSREMVRNSMELTKGKILQILALMLPFAIVLGGLSGGVEKIRSSMVESKVANIINTAASSDKSFGDDHTYVKSHFLNPAHLTESDLKAIISINNYYNPKTDGVDREYLSDIMPYITIPDEFSNASDDVRDVFFSVIQFLFFNEALLMVYYSIFCILKSTKKEEKMKMESKATV